MAKRSQRFSKFALAVAMSTSMVACATTTASRVGPRAPVADRVSQDRQLLRQAEVEHKAANELRRLRQFQIDTAYQRGVEDTLKEFRGQMHARESFVYEPPLVDMVEMPAQVINGALYPKHTAPVIYTPGRWIESNGIELPLTAPEALAGGRIEYVDEN